MNGGLNPEYGRWQVGGDARGARPEIKDSRLQSLKSERGLPIENPQSAIPNQNNPGDDRLSHAVSRRTVPRRVGEGFALPRAARGRPYQTFVFGVGTAVARHPRTSHTKCYGIKRVPTFPWAKASQIS